MEGWKLLGGGVEGGADDSYVGALTSLFNQHLIELYNRIKRKFLLANVNQTCTHHDPLSHLDRLRYI